MGEVGLCMDLSYDSRGGGTEGQLGTAKTAALVTTSSLNGAAPKD